MSLIDDRVFEIGTSLDGVITEVLDQDIRENGGSGKFSLLGILHTDKKVTGDETSDIYVYRIESIDEVRDYVKNAASEIFVSFLIPYGVYAKDIYPYRSNIEFTIVKEDLSPFGGSGFDSSVFIESKDTVRTNTERFKAVFLEKDNPKIKGGDFDFADRQTLDLSGIISVKLQLLNRSVEVLRTVTTGGCYSGVSRTDLIRSIVGNQANNIQIDGKPCLDALDICKADNIKNTEQVLLRQTLNVIHLPSELQEKHGGIYSTGLGSYIQRFNGLNTWFVFPLYDTTRYQDASRKAIFYAIRKDKFVISEKTFTRNQGKQYCHILISGEKVQSDDGESNVISDGVGFRQMSPEKFLVGGLDSFIKATEKGPLGLRSKNVTEVINSERLDGVSYAPSSSREISVNNFAEYSKVAYRLGSTITFTWDNADPDLLYPGMPCKYIYDDAGTPREVYGVVLFVQALTQMDNPTIVSSSDETSNEKATEVYSTKCVVGIFAQKMPHSDKKFPVLSDINVYAESGSWGTAKDVPVTNDRVTFSPAAGGVYVPGVSNLASTGQVKPGMSAISPITGVQLTSELSYWFKKMLGSVPSDKILSDISLKAISYCDQMNIVISSDFKIKDGMDNQWKIGPYLVGYMLSQAPDDGNGQFKTPIEAFSSATTIALYELCVDSKNRWSVRNTYGSEVSVWGRSFRPDRYAATSRPKSISTLDNTNSYPYYRNIPDKRVTEQFLGMSVVFPPVIDYEKTLGNDRVGIDSFNTYLRSYALPSDDYLILGTDTVYGDRKPLYGDVSSLGLDWLFKSLHDYISPLTFFYVTASCPDVETAEYIYFSHNKKVPLASLSDIARNKRGYFLKIFKEELSKLTIAQIHAALIWDGLEGYSLPDSIVRSHIPSFGYLGFGVNRPTPFTKTTKLPYYDAGIQRISGDSFFDKFDPDIHLMYNMGFLIPQNTIDVKLLTKTQKMFLYAQIIRSPIVTNEVAFLYSTINLQNMNAWTDKEADIVNKALRKALLTMTVEDVDLGPVIGTWSLANCENSWLLNPSNFRDINSIKSYHSYPRNHYTKEGLISFIPNVGDYYHYKDLRHLANLLEYGEITDLPTERSLKLTKIAASLLKYQAETPTSRVTRWELISKIRSNFSYCWYYGLTKNEPDVSDERIREAVFV